VKRFEAVFWMLFGAGGMAGAMALPALYFVIAVGFPLGLFGDPVETFFRMKTLFANPVGQLVLVAVIVLPFWHSAHHLRHFMVELGYAQHDRVVGGALYLLAAVGTLAALGIIAAL